MCDAIRRCGAGVAVLCIGVVWLAWSLLPGMAAGWVFATLETEWGVVGRAGQVDLDLVSLEVRVRDLTLAAAGTETQPFLTAEAVTLTLPWSAVFGAPAVDRLDIVAPVVSVRQGDDGTSNLPVLPPREASSDSPGEPLRLGVITVHRASVSWLDEARGLGVVAGSGRAAAATGGRRPVTDHRTVDPLDTDSYHVGCAGDGDSVRCRRV